MPRRKDCRIAILFVALCVAGLSPAYSGPPVDSERADALNAIPFSRLTPQASQEIRSIAERPTLFRRLPTQAIDCDPKMFIFLARHPEVLVGIWDRMDVSKVRTRRIGPYQIEADDSAGTTCTIDLVYGDTKVHVYVARGTYTGTMAPRPITGSGVFVLRSDYAIGSGGRTTVSGTLDCFMQLDSLGADLLARTLSGVIGKTADHNFIETARFMSQVSQAAERNPSGMRDLAMDLDKVEVPTRHAFANTIIEVARRASSSVKPEAQVTSQQPTPFTRDR